MSFCGNINLIVKRFPEKRTLSKEQHDDREVNNVRNGISLLLNYSNHLTTDYTLERVIPERIAVLHWRNVSGFQLQNAVAVIKAPTAHFYILQFPVPYPVLGNRDSSVSIVTRLRAG
jgi:hypothetical protein